MVAAEARWQAPALVVLVISCERKFRFVVYKVTFPNGKIYVGKDIGHNGHTIRYFGSWDADRVGADFTKEDLCDFTLRREILFESSDKVEVGRREMALIVELESNNPAKGYNRVPKFRGPVCGEDGKK